MPAATLDVSSAGGRVNMRTEKFRAPAVRPRQSGAIEVIAVPLDFAIDVAVDDLACVAVRL